MNIVPVADLRNFLLYGTDVAAVKFCTNLIMFLSVTHLFSSHVHLPAGKRADV